MMHLIYLALQYLRYHKIKTVILFFSIMVLCFLPLTVNVLVRDYQQGLMARAQSTPLIAGAPGSRFDLILHSLYFRSKPAGDLTMDAVDALSQSGLADALPLLSKHTAQGIPIVGTSWEYFSFRKLRAAEGTLPARIGDCVLGAAAAQQLGLAPGDMLMSDPENVFDLAGSYPLNMRVTGVLAPSGNADDQAIFTDTKTVWIIMGIMHGHEDAAKVEAQRLLKREGNKIVASAAVLPFQEITAENLDQYHFHGEEGTFPISAVIVVPHNAKSSAILRGRYQAPDSAVQLLVPEDVVSETLNLVFRIKRFFDAQAAVVLLAMVLLLVLIVMLSLRLRRREMETMFKIGCAKRTMFWLQTFELVIVISLAVLLAAGLSWVVSHSFGATLIQVLARP